MSENGWGEFGLRGWELPADSRKRRFSNPMSGRALRLRSAIRWHASSSNTERQFPCPGYTTVIFKERRAESHCRRTILRLWFVRQSWPLFRTRPVSLPAFLAWQHRDKIGLGDRFLADDFPAFKRIGDAVDVQQNLC